jgi:hypothetical protein
MIGTVLGQVTGQLEKRFVLNALFPTVVFVLACGLAAAAAEGGILAPVEAWEDDSAGAKVLIAIGAVGGVFLLANLLNNGMQVVIRLFEGYLVRPRFLAAIGRRRQLKRAGRLIAEAASESPRREAVKDQFEAAFPPYPQTLREKDVAATRLGNVIRSAETYSVGRYGADSVRVWSRLYPLLPEQITSSMVAARTSLEFLLAVSFLAGLYAPLASIYLILQNGPMVWIFASLGVGTLISVAAYHAALQPAVVYGAMVRAAFDLHRLDLIKAMAKPLPRNLAEEHQTWTELHLLFSRGTQDAGWRYVPPPSK